MVTFLILLILSKFFLLPDGTPTEVCTQFKDKKWGPKFFCLKLIFLSGLNEKFHINFAVDNVFDILVSKKNNSMIISMDYSVQTEREWFRKH